MSMLNDHRRMADGRGEARSGVLKGNEDFKNHYGWAAQIVVNSKKPKFEDLEKAAGLDHLHPYYRIG